MISAWGSAFHPQSYFLVPLPEFMDFILFEKTILVVNKKFGFVLANQPRKRVVEDLTTDSPGQCGSFPWKPPAKNGSTFEGEAQAETWLILTQTDTPAARIWLWWSKPFWDPLLVGAPPVLEPILVGIGMLGF